MTYLLRAAQPREADACIAVIEAAKLFQREQGFVQWTDDYPTAALIRADIAAQKGYVLTADGEIAAYMYIDFDGEPAYAEIEGTWATGAPYLTVHRMAFAARYRGRGLSAVAFSLIEALCRERQVGSIRMDTDAQNERMQHVLLKNGFTHRGVIRSQGEGKLAYDKRLRPYKS